ncbi:MAG: hypothetical protein JO253_06585 [Alphaproteobacteria bacterium]|nr:hypothetical protein [Alphaproteobacteria bacterium]
MTRRTTTDDTATNKTAPADLTGLAAEALALWQEHLAALSENPKAKADMAAWMEPSRRLFADWAAMMQNTGHANPFGHPAGTNPFAPAPFGAAPSGAAPTAAASDDSALRIAQLAHRVAELERRIGQLESTRQRKPAKAAKTSG